MSKLEQDLKELKARILKNPDLIKKAFEEMIENQKKCVGKGHPNARKMGLTDFHGIYVQMDCPICGYYSRPADYSELAEWKKIKQIHYTI